MNIVIGCAWRMRVKSLLQSAQGKCADCQCHCSTYPQSKTHRHKFFRPFAPSHNGSLGNTSGYYLTKNPPQGCTYRHCDQQSTASTYGGHPQNRHDRQCHHHQNKRNRAAHKSRQQPAHNHTRQPQTYCNRNSHQATNASYLSSYRENAAGQ